MRSSATSTADSGMNPFLSEEPEGRSPIMQRISSESEEASVGEVLLAELVQNFFWENGGGNHHENHRY